jgi:LEA14-like dessication related protein
MEKRTTSSAETPIISLMRSNRALSGNHGSTRTSEIRIVTRLFLLFLSALLIVAPSCRALRREVFRKPEVRIDSVKLSANPFLTKEPFDVVLNLAITNPNSYDLNISRSAFSISIGKQELASGEKNEQITLAASQETIVILPITLNPDFFLSALQQFIETRVVSYEITGSIEVRAPLVGVIRTPFSKTGAFDPLEFFRRRNFLGQ